jgi:hypothetical protein
METDFQTLLPRIIIALPFGIGTVAFLAIGMKRINRFFMMDYRGKSKERFKDNLIGNVFISLSIGCFLSAFFSFQEGGFKWGLLLLSLCFGAFILPIGVLGVYWRSYITNKLWGGFMPIVREIHGYAQPGSAKLNEIDPAKIKIPRRTTITALLIALLVFFGSYFLLVMIGWNGSPLSGLVFRLFVSTLVAFSMFMTIASAALSRRIQKLRNGESINDDKDN